MKGAILDWIRSVGLLPIKSGSVIIYTNPPSLTDLPANGLVTKAMLSFTTGQTITDIEGGVTENPITVAYGTIINPTLIFRYPDGSNYTGAANNVDNGTEIILTGDDDPTNPGHFLDTFTFIIKP